MKHTTFDTLETIASLLVQFPECAPKYKWYPRDKEYFINIIQSFKESGKIVEEDGQLLRTDELPDRKFYIRCMKETLEMIDEVDPEGRVKSVSEPMTMNDCLYLSYQKRIQIIESPMTTALNIMKELGYKLQTPDEVNVMDDDAILDFCLRYSRERMKSIMEQDSEKRIELMNEYMTDWLSANKNKPFCKSNYSEIFFNVYHYDPAPMTTDTLEHFICHQVKWDTRDGYVYIVNADGEEMPLHSFLESDVIRILNLMNELDHELIYKKVD